MKRFFRILIRFYQLGISPFLGNHCRFYPSCSEYCLQSIEKHGACKGIWRGLKRLLKCGPWNKGGVDLP